MSYYKVILILSALVCSAVGRVASETGNNEWFLQFKVNDRNFFVSSEEVSASNAYNLCKKQNLTLVALDAASNDAIIKSLTNLVGSTQVAFWTSGVKVYDKWVWGSTGDHVEYFDWGTGEPNDNDGKENCLQIWLNEYQSGHWNDKDCSATFRALCFYK
ncbi:unnamed protein product [Phyllotreta striolata]|uniref:C-type lectin domain-containing protein n=1 Tax=Phyllotreta striolata TaxID=444603 RepID=A0A9N9TP86_PHYSR|nr:unnamed protein product [Phyllotreta striolata]